MEVKKKQTLTFSKKSFLGGGGDLKISPNHSGMFIHLKIKLPTIL